MKEEIWKDVPGYEGFYQVSSLGRVKSISRKTNFGRNYLITKERILNQTLINGYYSLQLSKDGKVKRYPVHKLVAMTFLNHIPSGYKEVVNHINNIKTDNRPENLELCSNRYNSCYSKDKTKTTSKYIGVSYVKSRNKFVAMIMANDKNNFLGYFENEYDAHIAYEDYKKKYNLI